MKPFLVVDSNYIAHRIMYKMGSFSYQEKLTGVIFGFLRTISELYDRFSPKDMIFCWDSTKSWRKIAFPEYKANRNKDYSEEELKVRNAAYYQFNELQDDILPRIGFANIFSQPGVEADDLIAKVVLNQTYDKYIIISSDNDLYQLLALADIFLVDKKILFTKKDFDELYGIPPAAWLNVKALTGDASDNIPGVKGVGIKTAIKYLKNRFNINADLRKEIENQTDQITLNTQLMRIPHRRTLPIQINKSTFNLSEFEKVCLENGFQFFLRKEQYFKWEKMFNELNT